MNTIYIHKNDQQHGPFTEEKVRNFLEEGRFKSSDMGWIEGTPDWKPLGELLNKTAIQPPPLPPSHNPEHQPQPQNKIATPDRTARNNIDNPKRLVIASWLMIGLICLSSMMPVIGFATWVIAAPVLLITLILGIIVLLKGGTLQGILILLTSLIVAPLFLLIAPIITTAGMAATSESSSRGIPCAVCGKTAVYTPGATMEGLKYVCPNGHVTRSSRLVR